MKNTTIILLSICLENKNPTNDNILSLAYRSTQEIITSKINNPNMTSYNNPINLSLFEDTIDLKSEKYKILHMLTVSESYYNEIHKPLNKYVEQF